jgi:hypothetical protein
MERIMATTPSDPVRPDESGYLCYVSVTPLLLLCPVELEPKTDVTGYASQQVFLLFQMIAGCRRTHKKQTVNSARRLNGKISLREHVTNVSLFRQSF